jgi:hypothetical protein
MGPDPDGSCILYEKFDCTGKEIQTIKIGSHTRLVGQGAGSLG